MIKRWLNPVSPVRRIQVVSLLLFLLGLSLSLRLMSLTHQGGDSLKSRGTGMSTTTVAIPALRGEILDRHGRLLAGNQSRFTLAVDPQVMAEANTTHIVESLIEGSGVTLPEDFKDRMLRSSRFVVIASGLDAEQALWFRERHERGMIIQRQAVRSHPEGHLMCHLLGFTEGGKMGRGLEGLERMFNDHLAGYPGKKRSPRDVSGQILPALGQVMMPPVPGKDLRLTLDLEMQRLMESHLDMVIQEWSPQGAVALLMDPWRGDVLAMASRPTFDPDDHGRSPVSHYLNRAFYHQYEPGSIFKPFFAAMALDSGAVKPDEVFHCRWGRARWGRRVINDVHPYGELPLGDVIAKSSNIGIAQVAMALRDQQGDAWIEGQLKAMGFGQQKVLDLPGLAQGFLRPHDKWTKGSILSLPMGYEINVTPLQILRAFAAFANGGWLVKPRLFLDDEPQRQRIFKAETVDHIHQMLRACVVKGTGRAARRDDLALCGKTGTAEKIVEGKYDQDRNLSSFVCYGPESNPQLMLLMMVDEAKPQGARRPHGGSVCAKAASDIMAQCLTVLRFRP